MTDQDYDGSHIKGLILNFIQHWPSPQFNLHNISEAKGLSSFKVAVLVQVTRLHDRVRDTDCQDLSSI